MHVGNPAVRLGLLTSVLLIAALAPVKAAAETGSATVTRDVAPVYSAPEGRRVGRLRRGEHVQLFGVVDRREGSAGTVWVRVQRPGPDRYRGWMRARDLAPDTPERRTSPPAIDRSAPGALPGKAGSDGTWALGAMRSAGLPGVRVDIVDMGFECRGDERHGYFEACDVVTVVRLPGSSVFHGAPVARLSCEVAVSWISAANGEYRQTAHNSQRQPLVHRPSRASITLSYDFREGAISVLVASQECAALGL